MPHLSQVLYHEGRNESSSPFHSVFPMYPTHLLTFPQHREANHRIRCNLCSEIFPTNMAITLVRPSAITLRGDCGI